VSAEDATRPRTARGLRAAIEGVLPAERFADQRNILGNTGQNVLGLAIGALATFAAQVLMTRTLGDASSRSPPSSRSSPRRRRGSVWTWRMCG
jgi:hypothetical protein